MHTRARLAWARHPLLAPTLATARLVVLRATRVTCRVTLGLSRPGLWLPVVSRVSWPGLARLARIAWSGLAWVAWHALTLLPAPGVSSRVAAPVGGPAAWPLLVTRVSGRHGLARDAAVVARHAARSAHPLAHHPLLLLLLLLLPAHPPGVALWVAGRPALPHHLAGRVAGLAAGCAAGRVARRPARPVPVARRVLA